MMRKIPKHWPKDVPIPPPIPKRWFEDERGLFEHIDDLKKQCPDQWVAVVNKEVVASGKNLAEVERLAEEKTGEKEFPVWLVEVGASSIRIEVFFKIELDIRLFLVRCREQYHSACDTSLISHTGGWLDTRKK